MPVTEWFIIKSLTLPSSWVAVILALIITGIVLWIKFGKDTEDWYSDAAILFILVWKFSVLITDFEMILEFPLAILYFNGGKTGLFLGLLSALGRLLWQLKSKGWPEIDFVALIIAFVLLQSLYQFLMVSMNEAEFWQKLMTIAIFSGMTILTWMKVFTSNVWRLQLLVLLLLAHILAAIIQPEGLFQSPLLITVLFLICGITVYVFLNKRKMEENQ
ncbi:hypothetical protein M9R32_05355 [Paenisporosarcina quisquiliarum]|uniref:Uncharacterized protein n=1 Tax=Paenisporosarcina quisquiliarum TaxID=365346 RepID=A0A9X3LEU5_9BACL|nr:hypothetical protein [Paenisporosarcina quisquiliarum]MCZ8536608.1 hypothetical protein [Paenisporosarcina quisquiliarum]